MKQGEIKATSGYQAIKAKTLQFPPDLIDVKTSERQHTIKSSLDVSIPPLYAFRFLTPSHDDVTSSRASKLRTSNSHCSEDKRLPPVELTINKKIKFPHTKQHQVSKADKSEKVTTSDRDVIEQLRQHLRTQPRNGTTSVLEAIGDPQVREERFYYEPLSSFLENKEQASKEKLLGNTSGLRVVNIMIPAFGNDQDVNGDFVLPIALSRQQATNNRNTTRPRDGAVRAFSYLPKVVGNSLSRKEQKREANRADADARKSNSQTSTESGIMLPPGDGSMEEKLIRRGMYPRKTPVNLPRIGSRRDEEEDYDGREGNKRRKGVAPSSETPARRNATTVQLPTRGEEQNTMSGFPRRATTTATGKSHLIGPMNKMDMIAYYSRAMQERLISYDEYIKKLSVLSLHKITLPNSSMRHFQIVRDENHNMKPRLTHVDVNPMSAPQPSPVGKFADAHPMKILRPTGASADKVSKISEVQSMSSTDTKSPPRLHRVDIGEGLALSEEDRTSPDVTTDDVITTDLTRYSHVHHPRASRPPQYHWNHEAANVTTGGAKDLPGHVMYRERIRLGGVPPTPDRVNVERKSLGSREQRLGFAPRRLGSVSQDRWELPTVGEVEDPAYDPNIINTPDVAPVRSDVPSVGKIPYPATGEESTGLDAGEVLSVVDFRLPPEDVDAESQSDAESVFQPHLENMLKTIKRAKAGKRRNRVPEVRGLVPTVIPQLRVDESAAAGGATLRVDVKSRSPENLQIISHLPDHTPPPSAAAGREMRVKDGQDLFKSSTKQAEQSKENVKIVIDKANSQLIVNNQQSPRIAEKSNHHVTDTAQRLNSGDIRVTTASVELGRSDEDLGTSSETPSRLEIVITSVSSPQPPPNSVIGSDE